MSVHATAEPSPAGSDTEATSTGRTGAENAQETRADQTQVSDATTQEQTRGPDFFRQAFRQIRGYTQTAAPAPESQVEQPAKGPDAPQAPPASERPAPESSRSAGPEPQGTSAPPAGPATTLPPQRQQAAPDNRIVLTPEELQRRAQAEADRILAKRQKEDAARAEREREVELRRTNPFEYARLMESREQELLAAQEETKRLTGTLSEQLTHYDRNVLDIFVGALPEPVRRSVIAKEEGIPGRKATAAATVKALRSHWVAEGKASAKADLMKDQTFIKEILARYGGTTPEVESRPVAAQPPSPEGSSQNGNAAMNAWIKESARAATTSR